MTNHTVEASPQTYARIGTLPVAAGAEPYTSQDVMASVCKSLGISLETTFTSKSGRPMKIADGGKVIKELFV